MTEKPLNYQAAGVNTEQTDSLVKDIQQIAASTRRPGVLSNIGGFGALFELPISRMQHPVLVSGTDGVGTKLKLATQLNQHAGVGIDLVAMCVNDVICHGAEPLFFLDYFATSKLDREQAQTVLRSISQGCQQAGAALVGGETAEMPGMYQLGDYDLAGFCVGVVEKDKIIDGSRVQVGDQLIALAASGVHSNGFSLVRHILQEKAIDIHQAFGDTTLGATLLTPTRIYAKAIHALLKSVDVHAIAHITGGGLTGNLPRVLPKHTQAHINTNSWQRPAIFQWLQQQGSISEDDMYSTFNVGAGMVISVSSAETDTTLDLLQATGEHAWVIGEITSSDVTEPHVTYHAK